MTKTHTDSVAAKIVAEKRIQYLEEELAKARNELKSLGLHSSPWKDGAWNLKYAKEDSNV